MKPASLLCMSVPLWVALSACTKRDDTPVPPAAERAVAAATAPAARGGIAWLHAANDADADAAFARARREGKPVFVYWGAQWCPPCNHVKATLFNRQDFIERSRAFIPVYVDGDSPGAQRLGTRFQVRGYPTMVLFDAAGAELTRLPGEVDAEQYTEVLTLGMGAQRSAEAVLAQAASGGAGLSANDWKLLAYYSWETDQQRLLGREEPAALLKRLVVACPLEHADTADRLRLKALAAADGKAGPVPEAGSARPRVLALLADAPRSRRHMDVLTNHAAELARALSAAGSPERVRLASALDAALQRLQADATLSRADRLSALVARVQLARIDTAESARPVLPDPLLAQVRESSARFDREVTDGYERQAVVTAAAYALDQAGLLEESDALLKANLGRSHSPYYLMSGLADNAKKRGDKAASLAWREQAFDRSEGPATRLQWGAAYLNALVELAPQDGPRIERVAQQLIGEAAAMPDGFEGRSGRSMRRIGASLWAWNRRAAHAAVVERVQQRLHGVCARLPAGEAARRTCDAVLKHGADDPST